MLEKKLASSAVDCDPPGDRLYRKCFQQALLYLFEDFGMATHARLMLGHLWENQAPTGGSSGVARINACTT